MNQNEIAQPPSSAVFVIRIWREWSFSRSRWYGRVEWLDTKKTMTFRELAQLVSFLQASGLMDDGPATPSVKQGSSSAQ
jgi:hypothetical protein